MYIRLRILKFIYVYQVENIKFIYVYQVENVANVKKSFTRHLHYTQIKDRHVATPRYNILKPFFRIYY